MLEDKTQNITSIKANVEPLLLNKIGVIRNSHLLSSNNNNNLIGLGNKPLSLKNFGIDEIYENNKIYNSYGEYLADYYNENMKIFEVNEIEQKQAASERERWRMKSINEAFDILRIKLKQRTNTERRLSKIQVL
ncbi:unnamed protein product, partial [Gordionus sp. m RMFG-2023]